MKKINNLAMIIVSVVVALVSVNLFSSCSEEDGRVGFNTVWNVYSTVNNDGTTGTGDVNILLNSNEPMSVFSITISHLFKEIEVDEEKVALIPMQTASTLPSEDVSSTDSLVITTGTRQWSFDDGQTTTANWKTTLPVENPYGVNVKLLSITPEDYTLVKMTDKVYQLPTLYHVVVNATANGESKDVEFDLVPTYLHKATETVVPPTPEEETYAITLDFSKNEGNMRGIFTITGSKGYSASVSAVAASWGLCNPVETKYVVNTDTIRTDGITVSTKEGTINGTNITGSYVKTSRMSSNQVTWKTTSGGSVSASQNILLATSVITIPLPDGKNAIVSLDGKTGYENKLVKEDGHDDITYCEQEQSPAHYAHTFYQTVKHVISGTVTINGKTESIDFSQFGLTKDGAGYLLDTNTINALVVVVDK